jgi:hypothetical protein
MMQQDDLATASGWGRIAVQYDLEKWMLCPPEFPPGYDVRSWARTYAEAFCQRPGFSPTEELTGALAARLAEIHQDAYGSGRLVCHLCLIYQPDPLRSPLPVYFSAWDSRGGRDEALRLLSHADHAGAMQPPYVTEFTADRLGAGLKVLYYARHPARESVVYAGLNYAWRIEDLDTDLRVFVTTTDLGGLGQAIPDIDELMNVTSVVPRVG